MSSQLIAMLLQRPVAYQPVFTELTGSLVAGVMLSQIHYWSQEGRLSDDRDGWFYKTQQQWQAEIGLSRSEQDRARRALKKLGLLSEVRKGNPGRLWYRLNKAQLDALLIQFAETSNLNKNSSLQDSANKSAETGNQNENNTLANPDDLPADDENSFKNSSLQDSTNKSAETSKQECRILQTELRDSANKTAGFCNLNKHRLHTEITSETTESVVVEFEPVPDDLSAIDHADNDNDNDERPSLFDLDVAPASDLNAHPFEMHFEWTPSARFYERCRLQGVMLNNLSADEQSASLGAFVSYHEGQGTRKTQGGFEHLLAGWVQRDIRQREAEQANATPQARRAAVTAEIMDISNTNWAD